MIRTWVISVHALYLGVDYCDIGGENSTATSHGAVINSNITCLQRCNEWNLCTGYAVYAELDICWLYSTTVKSKKVPDADNINVECHVMRPTDNGDFPHIPVSDEDFVSCRTGELPKNTNDLIRRISTLSVSNPPFSDYMVYKSTAYTAHDCKRHCSTYPYILLQPNGKRSHCYCIERYDNEVDRFDDDMYFGADIDKGWCPNATCATTGECIYPGYEKHGNIAVIYHNRFPQDGDLCPDYESSHGHISSYMFLGGVSNASFEQVNATSAKDCALECKNRGPATVNHLGETAGFAAEKPRCHAYFFDGDNEQCRMFSDPIPKKKLTQYKRGASTYLCALRTCIQDTACYWGTGHRRSFVHVTGFRYWESAIAGNASEVDNCTECAESCTGNCTAYQCAESTNICHHFNTTDTDVPLVVSDVSLCLRRTSINRCTSVNGARPSADYCLCGISVCDSGQYCKVDSTGGLCLTSTPEKCNCHAPGVHESEAVCSSNGTNYPSECDLRCVANETVGYYGTCMNTTDEKYKCPATFSVTGTDYRLWPCWCELEPGINSTKIKLCAPGSGCGNPGASDACIPCATEATDNDLVCGKNDGKTYPDKCAVYRGGGDGDSVTPYEEGKCPPPACNAGESNCICTASSGNATECSSWEYPTRCSKIDGCLTPCVDLQHEDCGCGFGDDAVTGYKKCDANSFCHGSGIGSSCITSCNDEAVDTATCVCGNSACEKASCKNATGSPRCYAQCKDGDASGDCICGASSTLCHAGETCHGETGSKSCAAECTTSSNSSCFCRGVGSAIAICSSGANPSTVCSSLYGASEGKCIPDTCDDGQHDCRCGNVACMDSSRCFAEQCVSQCADGGSNCFCKGSENVSALTPVCNTNDTVDTFEGLSSSTYCDFDNDGETASCEAHCASSDGTGVITESESECFCGVDRKCKKGQYCLHSPGAEVGVCLLQNLTGECWNDQSSQDQQALKDRFEGKIPLRESCWCGGMPCAVGSYCQSAVGFCSPIEIQDCDKDKALSKPCQCWDVIARKTEMCQPSSETSALARTYADVPECEYASGTSDFCQCGSDFCTKDDCTLGDNKLLSKCKQE